MNCIKCGGKSGVYDSRPFENTIMRRRECKKCKTRYYTIEVLKPEKETVVKKKVVETKPPKINRRKYRRPTKRIEDLNFDDMTDEEIEAAIHSGDYV